MQVRMKGYTFSLSTPYEPGHRLTPGEAKALNDLRLENIQNNFRHKINAQIARLEPGQLLAQHVLDELQAELSAYDADYKFNEKSTRSRMGDIEREARAIARERVLAQATLHDLQLTDEFIAVLIEQDCKLPAVIEEARNRVAARRAALSAGLESL